MVLLLRFRQTMKRLERKEGYKDIRNRRTWREERVRTHHPSCSTLYHRGWPTNTTGIGRLRSADIVTENVFFLFESGGRLSQCIVWEAGKKLYGNSK